MASNPYKNKIVYNGTTLIDLTADTVTPERLLEGYTAHDASGAPITGTATGGRVIISDTQDSHGGTIREITVANVITLGTKNITENGTYTAATEDLTGYSAVTVNVGGGSISLQSKSVNPTEEVQTVVADSGYDGLSSVEVGAIDSEYVGSDVARRTSTNLTASGATVTAPAGYYAAAASKSVASGSATTPATSITANPSISVSSTGLITATASASKSVTPSVSAGYVSAGTAGTVTVSGSNTEQLTVQAAKTVTPTETAQDAVAAGVYTTGKVTVAAIPSTYVGSGITQRDETDLTASGATVTVPAGYYASQETKSVSTTTHADPSVSINSSTGLVTASHTQAAGYVSAGTTSDTLQLTTQAAATITPTKSSQTAVAAGRFTTGAVTVAAIPSQYITTTDATASAADIASGETAYVNGSKVTGTLTFATYYTGSGTPSASQGSDGDIYLKVVN